MSIFSEYKCGALSDFEFEQECRRMNREERYYEAMESASMYYWNDEFEGCPYDYAEVDEGDECIGCKFYDVCKECFENCDDDCEHCTWLECPKEGEEG